jgi:hypothetical protein
LATTRDQWPGVVGDSYQLLCCREKTIHPAGFVLFIPRDMMRLCVGTGQYRTGNSES